MQVVRTLKDKYKWVITLYNIKHTVYKYKTIFFIKNVNKNVNGALLLLFIYINHLVFQPYFPI